MTKNGLNPENKLLFTCPVSPNHPSFRTKNNILESTLHQMPISVKIIKEQTATLNPDVGSDCALLYEAG